MTFGAGSQDFEEACSDLYSQAVETGIFEFIFKFGENTLLEPEHSFFKNQYYEFIKANKRGFGLWIWKSYLINFVLNKLNDGDVLIYADSGCRFRNKKYLPKLIDRIKQDTFVATLQSHAMKPYTSSKVLFEFDPECTLAHQRQVQATMLGVCVNEESRAIIHDWVVACSNEELLLDPDRKLEPLDFIDHRHDQSILSLLLYSKYHHYLPNDEHNEIFYKAIGADRIRHKFDLKQYSQVRVGGYLMNILPVDDFKSISFSSHSHPPEDTGLLQFESLIAVEFKSPYAFHTSHEIAPFLLIELKASKSTRLLVIENREGLEWRIKSLSVAVSEDALNFEEVATVGYSFGGFYNNDPCIISLPAKNYKFLKITSNNIEPLPMHLKSVYLYS